MNWNRRIQIPSARDTGCAWGQHPPGAAGLATSLLVNGCSTEKPLFLLRGGSGSAPGCEGNWLKASSGCVISWTLSWLGAAQATLFGWLHFFFLFFFPFCAARGPPWICTIKLLSVLNHCSENYNGVCLKRAPGFRLLGSLSFQCPVSLLSVCSVIIPETNSLLL